MLGNKGIAFQTLVLMIIALAVLAAVLMFWTGAFGKIGQGTNRITDSTNQTVSDATRVILISRIKMNCGNNCMDPLKINSDASCRTCVCNILKKEGIQEFDLNGDGINDVICS